MQRPGCLKGKVLFEIGSEKEALHAFEQTTRQKPNFPEAWYEKGRVFLKLGNPKGAENAFKIAAALGRARSSERKLKWPMQKLKGVTLEIINI